MDTFELIKFLLFAMAVSAVAYKAYKLKHNSK